MSIAAFFVLGTLPACAVGLALLEIWDTNFRTYKAPNLDDPKYNKFNQKPD